MATKNNHWFLLAGALLVWIFAGNEIFQRAIVALNGTVVSSETSCMQPENNRCATEYVIESSNHSLTTYIAGPTDKSLPRRLPVGTQIVKSKWALSYSINGQYINDFPIISYGGLLVFGLFCIGWWYALSKGNT